MTSTETAPRWFQRVVPVTALALALVGLAALLLPAVRHQVALSTTHQPQPYVELYFARTADGPQVVCARDGERVRVSFSLASHLPDVRDIDWQVLVAGGTSRDSADRSGTARVAPGRTTTVDETLAVTGRDGYSVQVDLSGLDEHLRAHCDGAAS